MSLVPANVTFTFIEKDGSSSQWNIQGVTAYVNNVVYGEGLWNSYNTYSINAKNTTTSWLGFYFYNNNVKMISLGGSGSRPTIEQIISGPSTGITTYTGNLESIISGETKIFSDTFLTSQLTNLSGKMTSTVSNITSLTTAKNNLIVQVEAMAVEPSSGTNLATYTTTLNTLSKNYVLNMRNYIKGGRLFNKYVAHFNTLTTNATSGQQQIITNSGISAIRQSYTTATNNFNAGNNTWKTKYAIALLISENS